MISSSRRRIAVLVVAAGCVQAYGAVGAGVAGDELRGLYPDVRMHVDGGRVRMVYGAPMTVGLTAREAAEGWLVSHGGVFGAGALELEELFATPVMSGRFTALGYRQYIDGLPVEYGNVRVLVLNAPVPRVVYAAATVAAGEGLAARMHLDGATAREIVQAMPLFRGMDEWTEPELAVYQGNGEWIDPAVVWKFTGGDGDRGTMSKTFFVDTATGRLVHVRNEIYSNDITGTVKGWATQGTFPDAATNPPTLQDVEDIRVLVQGGPSTFTGAGGSYLIGNAGSSSVNVRTGVGLTQGLGGRWVDVNPAVGAAVEESKQVLPPGQADFVLNVSPSEHLTAQVNAFIGTTLVHNHFKSRAPGYTALDMPLRANTSTSGSCNAFFFAAGPYLSFLAAGGSCPNMAYSSVISHEYGHFIVNRLNLGQGGFGEGYGDTTAMMVYDDRVIARNFQGPGNDLRDPVAANVQYPCTSGAVHHCGQILAASWWRIRTALGATHGAAGLDMTRERNVAWSLITLGGAGNNFIHSAHPGTAIEVLTVDDDDGNLANGTPNWEDICGAFASANVQCPPLTYLGFELPEGKPEFVPPDQEFGVRVNIIPMAAASQQGMANVVYRLPGGSFTTVPMSQVGTDQYVATVPALACGEHAEYYFTAQTMTGQTIRHPEGAPGEFFTTTGGYPAVETLQETQFAAAWPAGWWATGMWQVTGVCAPVGNVVAGCDVGPYAYYGRTSTCNFNLPTGANSGQLNAPSVSLPALTPNERVALRFCYALETDNVPQRHRAEVFINGQTRPEWRMTVVVPTLEEPDLYWAQAEVDLTEFAGQSVDVSFRFDTGTHYNNAFRGWHLNNVRIEATMAACTSPCYANCDQSTTAPLLNVDDFTCFINAFAAGSGLPHAEQVGHYANCDGSSAAPVLNVDDFTCFINSFAAGCR